MLCPSCKSLMTCRSQIHDVPNQPGKRRMDLHCSGWIKSASNRCCFATCHMGVITEDDKIWQCHEYSFSFKRNDKSYYMRSYDKSVDVFHQGQRSPTTRLSHYNYDSSELIYLPLFIPISTGDDMHEEVLDLFDRMLSWVALS